MSSAQAMQWPQAAAAAAADLGQPITCGLDGAAAFIAPCIDSLDFTVWTEGAHASVAAGPGGCSR